jgi:hypothetical protein
VFTVGILFRKHFGLGELEIGIMGGIWPVSQAVKGISRGEKEAWQAELDPDYLVKWDVDDPMNPQNWPARYKWWVTFQLGMLALAGSLGSSIMTPADSIITNYVGVSREVGVLDVSLYL